MNGFRRPGHTIAATLAKFGPAVQAGGRAAWWLAGDIPGENCLAAYQPKGAASYTASKINLANPGTYDAAEGISPVWGAAIGWRFDGSSAFLTCGGLTPTGQGWSYLVRFANLSNPGRSAALFGQKDQAASAFTTILMYAAVAQNRIRYYNGPYSDVAPSPYPVAACLGLAGTKCYRDGIDEGITIGAWNGISPNPLSIGCLNERGAATLFAPVDVIAFAVYDCVLSAGQVAAVHAAMGEI